jgi:hypothetical protein
MIIVIIRKGINGNDDTTYDCYFFLVLLKTFDVNLKKNKLIKLSLIVAKFLIIVYGIYLLILVVERMR